MAWQSWSASNGSWDEGTWEKKCQEVENEVKDVTRVERGEGILDVKIGGRFAPVYQEPTWNEHEEKMIWARLQTGRKTSLCSHLKVDVRRSVRIRRSKWLQVIALRRKAWRAKVGHLLPGKTG